MHVSDIPIPFFGISLIKPRNVLKPSARASIQSQTGDDIDFTVGVQVDTGQAASQYNG